MTTVKKKQKRILVAPLNWGLGHTTRCLPIIKALENHNFEPILASDGASLELLKKEFPHLQHIELPSYNISYSFSRATFKIKLIALTPQIFKAIREERKVTQKLLHSLKLDGIISDNRLGVQHKKIPSVYITHQLNVFSGSTTWLSSRLHRFLIKKFKQCWIPDFNSSKNLSGRLGHLKKRRSKLKYIGPLSRLKNKASIRKYDILAVLSGPEPQRTIFEKKLITELSSSKKQVLFIKGIIEPQQKTWQENNITFYNYMDSFQLENAFNESGIVVCRSGYSTIMDLVKLNKKAYFIPTPGQYEQEYLAKRLKHYGYVPFCKQNEFNLLKLDEVNLYNGLKSFNAVNTN